MWAFVFWISLGLVLYVYLGYPLLVALIAAVLDRRVRRAPCEPAVTILIAAHNEEASIRQTLQNKLSLDYPRAKLNIIVVSDGSTDRTDEIVREFESERVRLIRQEPRNGKTEALNKAVQEARGEIVVFSDANSIYDEDALRHLLANFADPDVGYVTGRIVYTRPGDLSGVNAGCSSYMGYETFLRLAETRAGSLVGVNGGIDAVRRELYQPMRADQQPDFVLPMMVVDRGYRVVFEPSANLYEASLNRSHEEFRMRVRVALRALRALWDMRRLLNPFEFPFYSWQLFSHKLLRYLAFFPLLSLYASNLFLLRRGLLYDFSFFLQTTIYCAAVIGYYFQHHRRILRFLHAPFYFCLLNLAALTAFFQLLSGKTIILWNPRKG